MSPCCPEKYDGIAFGHPVHVVCRTVSRDEFRDLTHAHTRTDGRKIYARETSSDPFTDNNNIPTGPAEDSAGGDVNGPAAIRTGRVPIERKKHA